MDTIGKRISEYRKKKNLKQDELAEMLGVSPQAVSKWENDLSCPDISLLPELSRILGVSIDEIVQGKKEEPIVSILPEEERKDINKLMLRIVVDSEEGDRVRVNLPMALVKVAIETGISMPQINGSEALKNIDFAQIFTLVENGAIGNLVEVDSADGDTVRIFVE
ncbi:MAG: helix-turn-helix transcriptional regulator [Clostridia bacterium]|nr:helix-turn-helix transcriptional regulator [Clostridia bacterium]